MSAIHLTKGGFLRRVADFENNPQWEFLGTKPAVLDFYAPWCGPCKMLSPVIDELADEYQGKIDIYKINVDEEQELAEIFGIRTIPTLIFIPMQGDPQRSFGAKPKAELKKVLDAML